jgi:hypothetical protein
MHGTKRRRPSISVDLKIEAPQHLAVNRGDIDLPFPAVSIFVDLFKTPGPPEGGSDVQVDLADDLPLVIINVSDGGRILLCLNKVPHIDALHG